MEAIFKELWRVCRDKAVIKVIVPHHTKPYALSDIYMRRLFGYWSFTQFTMLENIKKKDAPYFEIKDRRLIFAKGLLFHNYLLEPLANMFPSLYEYVLSSWFRCWSYECVLIVAKH